MSKDEESDSVEKIGINSIFDSDRLCQKRVKRPNPKTTRRLEKEVKDRD